MGQEILVASIGVVTFLFAYMLFKLGERPTVKESGDEEGYSTGGKHFLLQLLLLFFIAGGVLLLGKVSVDDHCTYRVTNTTTVGDYDVFNYETNCEESTGTALTFYKGVLWFVRLLFAYIFLYFVYEVLVYLGWVVPKTGGGN